MNAEPIDFSAQPAALQGVAPMSPLNRLIAYSAAMKLRSFGFEWNETSETWSQAAPAADAVAGMPPGISALMCVISSLRDTAHFSDENGELIDELRTLRDWAMTQATAPTPAAQADSQAAPQGETNVQLDTDSNTAAPGQQRDVAGSVALGQPMGNGPDQVAGYLGAQGDKLLTVAERNIRSFLRSAVFKSESDREAALSCVDVLRDAARAPADSVLEDAARWQELREQHESDADRCCVFAPNDMHECLVPVGSLPGELDAFMDSERQKSAARKQGGGHV